MTAPTNMTQVSLMQSQQRRLATLQLQRCQRSVHREHHLLRSEHDSQHMTELAY